MLQVCYFYNEKQILSSIAFILKKYLEFFVIFKCPKKIMIQDRTGMIKISFIRRLFGNIILLKTGMINHRTRVSYRTGMKSAKQAQ